MLVLTVLGEEYFDEENGVFMTKGDVRLELEHSLVSLSKWESIVEKPFLTEEEKTPEEIFEYIKCMILTPDYPPDILDRFSEANISEINKYMNATMTATRFYELNQQSSPNQETITAELIYYWMFTAGIPIECERWPLQKLFTLIKVFGVKAQKPKKMSSAEVAARNRELNAARRKQLGTSG